MRKHHLSYIIILIAVLCFCGCTQTVSDSKPDVIPIPPSTSLTTIPTFLYTPIITPTSTPLILKDPIIGTWMCYSYTASGRIKKEYTFIENNTWSRTNTNLKSMRPAYSHGTWRKESDTKYSIKSSVSGGSATFQYDITKDELYDPGFQETFHRISDADNPSMQATTMNITVQTAIPNT